MSERQSYNQKKTYTIDTARKMPHNLDAEQAVLSCMLIDNNAAMYISQQLSADSFYTDSHRVIFEAAEAVLSRPDGHQPIWT